MTRWDPGDKQQMLQQIADDERRPLHEREAARRELAIAGQPKSQPSSRRARDADAPTSQSDIDSEIEAWYQRVLLDNNLTASDRREIFPHSS